MAAETESNALRGTAPSSRGTRTCTAAACSLDATARRGSVPDAATRCEHFDAIRKVRPQTDGCAECLALGMESHELRVCLTCGHVGCCEDSAGRHAQRHFEETGHPMIASYERLETWGWCYVHRRYFDPMPMALPQRPYVWQAWIDRLLGRRARAA